MQIPALIITALLFSFSANALAQGVSQSPVPSKPAKAPAADQLAEPGAVSTSRLALPFKRAWQYLTDDALALPPTLDGARIYLPLAGGRVFCLDRGTGTRLWAAEPGGLISAPNDVSVKVVYVAARQ